MFSRHHSTARSLRLASNILALFLGVLSSVSVQAANEDALVYASPVVRFAIVISEADYVREDHRKSLKNTVSDGERIGYHLHRAGFNTRVMIDPTKQQIFGEIESLVGGQVRHENNQGRKPTVVVYFSGHGFQVGNEDYLAPKEFRDSEPVKTSIPISSIIDSLAKSTNVILFSDACRTEVSPESPATLGESVEAPAGADDAFDRPAPAANGSLNYLKAFAVEAGGIAASFVKQSDISSPYVQALEMYVFAPGADLLEALADVRETVPKLTSPPQRPIHQPGGAGRSSFFMIATAEVIRRSRDDLRMALRSGDPAQVVKFISRNGSSPYLQAAMAWLDERTKSAP